eukprot:scaffold98340_cov48-Phaeocystis_antarctica.AAC.3
MSANFSRRPRSSPIFIVIELEGHEPHAPCSSNSMIPPSMDLIATLPPSASRYGRISSSTRSTFSIVSSSISPGAASPSPSVNGETTVSASARWRRPPRGDAAACLRVESSGAGGRYAARTHTRPSTSTEISIARGLQLMEVSSRLGLPLYQYRKAIVW